jgi:hypothetical protein
MAACRQQRVAAGANGEPYEIGKAHLVKLGDRRRRARESG